MDKSKQNIMICGGSGYIGSSFAQYLLRKNTYSIVIVDNMSGGWNVNKGVAAFYKADVGDYTKMREIINKHKIGVVFHFCASLEVNESVMNPLKYYDNNIGNAVKLLQACVDEECYNFVFSSSAAVYGEPKYTPIDEDHTLKPINPYGRTKKYFEKILKDLNSANKEFNYISLRYFNVAGALDGITTGEAHEPESHLIPNVLDAALGKRKFVSIFGTDYDTKDGTCVRDYIHMEDLCNAHEKAMLYLINKKMSDTFNLGTGSGYSIREIISMIKKVTEKDFQVVEGARREGDPATLVASNVKAKDLLEWTPIKSLEEIISSAFYWHSKKDCTVHDYKIFKENNLLEEFQRIFEPVNTKDIKLFFAPGRINFIGEHTDYNGGFVLPCSINKGTYMIGQTNDKNLIRIYSQAFSKLATFNLHEDFKSQLKGDWSDHLGATLYIVNQLKKIETGLDIYCYSNMPLSAGLSSSASVIVAGLLALTQLFQIDLGANKNGYLVELALRVEHEGLGVKCGIMDQFAIINGQKDKLLLLNCDTKEFKVVSAQFGSYRILVANTNYKRQLKDSKYNERVEECQQALKLLQPYKVGATLSDYTVEELPEIERVLSNEILFRRTKHVITENKRVMDCIAMLKEGNFVQVGTLLNQSHFSLKDDYEVTGLHLDTLVEGFHTCKGVLGARMMGAGFGGCTVSLVEASEIRNISCHVREHYIKTTHLEPSFYEFSVENGAQMVNY